MEGKSPCDVVEGSDKERGPRTIQCRLRVSCKVKPGPPLAPSCRNTFAGSRDFDRSYHCIRPSMKGRLSNLLIWKTKETPADISLIVSAEYPPLRIILVML